MKNTITALTIIFMAVLCIPALNAQNIYFNFKDGTNASYAISDVRTITFTGNMMNLNKWDGTTFSWNVNTIGNYNYSGFTSVPQGTIASDDVLIYPNPANGPISIQYKIESANEALVEFIDINGKTVKTFPQKQNKAGSYTVIWDGLDQKGSYTKSGIYFCRITIGGKVISKKLIITN